MHSIVFLLELAHSVSPRLSNRVLTVQDKHLINFLQFKFCRFKPFWYCAYWIIQLPFFLCPNWSRTASSKSSKPEFSSPMLSSCVILLICLWLYTQHNSGSTRFALSWSSIFVICSLRFVDPLAHRCNYVACTKHHQWYALCLILVALGRTKALKYHHGRLIMPCLNDACGVVTGGGYHYDLWYINLAGHRTGHQYIEWLLVVMSIEAVPSWKIGGN